MARLYVARDRRRPERHDLGSLLCVHALRLLPPDTVQVTEVTSLSQAHHPAWLTGTPTLVVDQQQVLRGHQALQYLQDLAVSLPKQKSSAPPPSRAAPSSVTPPTGASGPAAPPAEDDDPWSVAPVEAQDEDADRKVTSDDLMRLMREREQQQGPPPMV